MRARWELPHRAWTDALCLALLDAKFLRGLEDGRLGDGDVRAGRDDRPGLVLLAVSERHRDDLARSRGLARLVGLLPAEKIFRAEVLVLEIGHLADLMATAVDLQYDALDLEALRLRALGVVALGASEHTAFGIFRVFG